jgi:twitching motility protein PilT
MAPTNKRLFALLQEAITRQGSDLHVGSEAPMIRVFGELLPAAGENPTQEELADWVRTVLSPQSYTEYQHTGDADFVVPALGSRFRCSVYRERGKITLAFRVIQTVIPGFDELALPQVVRDWHHRDTGLVIVCGPTGSGKSTTMASLVNQINHERSSHILTIEDPVEYEVIPKLSTIHQREIGTDAVDFPRAVRAALREDIDVLVIGEMRDKETMAAAITVAETGHLVFATLHTSSAAQAVDRIIDAFEPAEQPLIRSRLSAVLVGVVYQRLLPKISGGRCGAFEVLVANYPIQNLIREGKTFQIPNMMTTGAAVGMQTMSAALEGLVKKGDITSADAAEFLQQNLG